MMLEKFVNKFKTEGVDHVRIHPFAETRLGKICSQDWRFTFFIPHMGEFTSPVCFANWLATGDEEARHNVRYRCEVSVKGYLQYVLFAKYYQLCGMRNTINKEKEQLSLPFVAYKIHTNGLKEFDRWKEYPSVIKEMIDHILDPELGPKTDYPWEDKFPGLVGRIDSLVSKIVGERPEQSEEKMPKKGKRKTAEVTENQSEEIAEEVVTSEAEVVAE